MLTIRKQIEGAEALVALEGRLDTITAPQLETELRGMMPELKTLTLDFAMLDYISSAGLRVLLIAQKNMARQGTLKLVHVNETIMEILEVTGFSDILDIER